MSEFQSAAADGWLGFRPVMNTSNPLYAVLKTGFNKYWLQGYLQNLTDTNNTSPDKNAVTSASFNAIVGVAHTLDTMFVKSVPPIYIGSKVGVRPIVCHVSMATLIPCGVGVCGDFHEDHKKLHGNRRRLAHQAE